MTGAKTSGAVDDLETLVIVFDRTTYPRGVKNVSLTVNAANSNLGPSQTVIFAPDGTGYSGVVVSVNYSIFDISGNLIGQFASPARVPSRYRRPIATSDALKSSPAVRRGHESRI
ncbi:MAG: hypothetical protein IPH41_17645 [Sulfuritalea sp.]|nr:hypothetical protein [Sulfuritalea sp.]